MTDTNHIDQRARELLAAECDRTVEGMHYDAYGVVTLNVALSAIRRALSARASAEDAGDFASDTAALAFLRLVGNGNPNIERAVKRLHSSLIARASAGEAVEIIEDAIKLASDGVTFGCPADVADWMRDALTAAPQPAQAGASGGGEIPVCPRCSKALPPRRGAGRTLFSTPCTDCMEWKSPHRDTPASPATGGDPPFVDDKITIADVAGVLGEMAENFDGGEYTISEETRCVLIDFAHGITQHDLFSIIEYHFKQKYATPQPESAGEWDSFDERAVKFAVHPQQATCKDSLQVPPAHGDGEGEFARIAASKPCPACGSHGPCEDAQRCMNTVIATNFRGETFAEARQQLVNVLKAQKSWVTGYAESYVDEFADMASTRPTPEAQEARDAVDARRYRYLRDHCKREWYSDMPHNKGAPSLDIEFEARGHDLDAAVDAALALPAQGEGK